MFVYSALHAVSAIALNTIATMIDAGPGCQMLPGACTEKLRQARAFSCASVSHAILGLKGRALP